MAIGRLSGYGCRSSSDGMMIVVIGDRYRRRVFWSHDHDFRIHAVVIGGGHAGELVFAVAGTMVVLFLGAEKLRCWGMWNFS